MSLSRVLLVDDEPAVLEGIQRLLRKQYDITLANGPQAALDAIDPARPFAVVVSDMRMPGMNGAQLLSRFYERTPDTVRMLLTGQADLDAAISAVNDGHLFRFLTKPCPHELFAPALAAAVEQHRLVTSERVLLEQTLLGTTRALTEMLSLLDPGTFGAAMRQHERVRTLAGKLQVKQAFMARMNEPTTFSRRAGLRAATANPAATTTIPPTRATTINTPCPPTASITSS